METNTTFFDDFKAFQNEVPNIPLGSTAKIGKYSFKFAGLPAILKIVRPILSRNNFVYSWSCNLDGSVTCNVLHKSGQAMESTCLIKGGDDPKNQGASITYAKRYSFVALLGIIADEDKDAPGDKSKPKPKLKDKAFEQAKNKIVNGNQNVAKQCLLHFDLTEKQENELVNLELEYNG